MYRAAKFTQVVGLGVILLGAASLLTPAEPVRDLASAGLPGAALAASFWGRLSEE